MHQPANKPNDLEKLFVERTNAGDLEGLMALYAPNAIIADGDDVIAVGQKQSRKFFTKFLAQCPQVDSSLQAPALCSGGGAAAGAARRRTHARFRGRL